MKGTRLTVFAILAVIIVVLLCTPTQVGLDPTKRAYAECLPCGLTAEQIDALIEKGTWYEDHKSNATTKIIPSQWVFRIKRTPDGVIKKFKARIVLRGDLQEDNG